MIHFKIVETLLKLFRLKAENVCPSICGFFSLLQGEREETEIFHGFTHLIKHGVNVRVCTQGVMIHGHEERTRKLKYYVQI